MKIIDKNEKSKNFISNFLLARVSRINNNIRLTVLFIFTALTYSHRQNGLLKYL